jgi:hypothetical protein
MAQRLSIIDRKLCQQFGFSVLDGLPPDAKQGATVRSQL